MGARSIAVKTITTALLAVVLSLGFADPAAAVDEVELSQDGVSYGSTLSSPLFTGPSLLIPLESREASFWVRNSSSFDSVMRIGIQGSTWTDDAYATQLTVQASVPSASGALVSVATTASCRVLLTNVTLDPGEEVEVTITLALGDLDGSAGQSAEVALNLGVILTQAPGDGTGCSATPQVPVIVPGTNTGGSPKPTPTPTATAGPVDEGPDEETPPFVAIAELIANTFAGFDSAFIGWGAASTIAGVIAYLVMGFARGRNGTDESTVPAAGASTHSSKDLS